MAQLKRSDDESGSPILIEGEAFSLGRDEGCGLPLQDVKASRHHAEIRKGPRGWRIQDLGSTNGTYVNGLVIEETALHPGDRLRIGDTVLRFEDPEAEAQEGAAAPSRRYRVRALVAGILLLICVALAGWPFMGGPPEPLPAPPSGGLPGSPPPLPARLPSPTAEGRPDAPAPEAPKGPTLDLFVHVVGSYDHPLETPDQNWARDQELELELVGIPLKGSGGIYKGLRLTPQSHDEVECRMEGGRVKSVTWRAARRIMRTLADGRTLTAREESWEFQSQGLDPGRGNADDRPGTLSFAWRPGGPPTPTLLHSVRLFPEKVQAQIIRAAWTPEGKNEAEEEAKVRLAFHP